MLDTNIVRQAHEPTLKALKDKGARLAINAVAVGEWIARAARGRSDRGPTPGIFYGPARRIAPYLDGCCPVIPERGRLLPIVMADGFEREQLLYDELAFMRRAWENLLRAESDELVRAGAMSADHLDCVGEIYTKLNKIRGDVLKKPVHWRDVYEKDVLPAFASDWTPLRAERLNAMLRVNRVPGRLV